MSSRALVITLFTAIAASLAGCATENTEEDASGSAISGAPGPALARAEAERRRENEARLYAAVAEDRLLARYTKADSSAFSEVPYHLPSLSCVRGSSDERVFRWHPAPRRIDEDTSDRDYRMEYEQALRGARFDPKLHVRQRSADGGYELSFIAVPDILGVAPCERDGAFKSGARVVLRCTNVAADHGPDATRCHTPIAGTPDADPR